MNLQLVQSPSSASPSPTTSRARMENMFPGVQWKDFDQSELLSKEERNNIQQAPTTGWIGGAPEWNDLLLAPASNTVGSVLEWQTRSEQPFLGEVEGILENASGLRGDLASGAVWSGAQADLYSNQQRHLHVDEAIIAEENMSLPSLSSGNLPPMDLHLKNISDTLEKSQNVRLLSSSASCGGVESKHAPSSNSGNEAENVASNSHSAILTSCSDQRPTHLEAGYDSSVLSLRRSYDNFVKPSKIFGDNTSGEIDKDAKRQTRNMRNRESSARSRQKSKARVKQVETDCHAKAQQITSLEETLASTMNQKNALQKELVSTMDQKNVLQKELSQYRDLSCSSNSLAMASQVTILECALVSAREQNDALQKELAQYRCLNQSGLQFGAMEPAELPKGNENDELKQTTPGGN